MNTEKLITIIIPAYNAEPYLNQCLDSLIYQTMNAHKIIVVDDGSKDRTKEIVQDYVNRYPDMVTYIWQENQGQGAARNNGMQYVETPFTAFLDSDDWQNNRFIEDIVHEIEFQDEIPDIIFTLPWIYDSSTSRIVPWYDSNLYNYIFFDGNPNPSCPSKVLNVKTDRRLYEMEVNVCRRVFRTQFLKEIQFAFPVNVKWEDVKPHFDAIHHAKRCIAVRTCGFFYRINNSTQTTAGKGETRMHIVPVFQDAVHSAIQEGWCTEEIAYILRTMLTFSSWSIAVTNTEYILPLLKGLHQLFRSIPNQYFNVYLGLCSGNKRKDALLIKLIRSPFYGILKDYRVRQNGMVFIRKIYSIKRLFRRK